MKLYGHLKGSIATLAAKLADAPIALRWGGRFVPGAINGEAALLDGLEQLQTFRAAGVPCPDFVTSFAEAQALLRQGKTVFGRMRDHTQGKDIIAASCDDPVRVGAGVPLILVQVGRRRVREFARSDFYTVYAPAKQEWRFHCLRQGPKVLSIARALKVKAEGEVPTIGRMPAAVGAPVVRSRRLGWVFRHDIGPPKAIREAAKAALLAVGYDLGAVDVLELPDGSACVLEVNSRPALRDEYTLERYALALRKYAGPA